MAEDEFYMRPLFSVRDVPASLAYYCEKLGFKKAWAHPADAPIIAQVGRNGLDVILDAESVIPRAGRPSVLSMSLHQLERLGALHRELADRGAGIVSPPSEVPWEKGLFQLVVKDPDGNLLVFWGHPPSRAAGS